MPNSSENNADSPENEADDSQRSLHVTRVTRKSKEVRADIVAAEEPLEIRIVYGPVEKRRSKSLSITMRTPGNDAELANGFLLSENIVSHPSQISECEFVGPAPGNGDHGNTLMVELGVDVEIAIEKLQRHFYTTSSCGICGKASLDAVRNQGTQSIKDTLLVKREVVFEMPNRLRVLQDVFDKTGGLHAAGLANSDGQVIEIREDVGRHNAVDKLIGSQMLTGSSFPLSGKILVVSGRASFELVQKALMASIPMMVAVGAPSSLAVELAKEFGLTLIGFASETRFNIYSGEQRVV
ncbi:MAG: formate dehydrogenase accessory sulfurtransferase FdhD [Mariniblastus sp.]